MKRILPPALAACLFLLIVGAKWAIFDRYGSPMPDWDQWDAEGVNLLVPWLDRNRLVAHLFEPHNEHRVVLTKLQSLALVVINGQWDARLEAVTNAMLHASLAVGFWICGRRWIAVRWHAPVFLLIAAFFALPFAWQNTLGGFHSQQYWLLVLSFIAMVVLPIARTWSASWWVGVLSAILALGSMGSGLLAAAVVMVVVAWRLMRREMPLRAGWPTLTIMTAVVAVGLLTRVEIPEHEPFKAKTLHDFIFSIVHSLEWPMRGHHWAAAVLWLPWLLVVWRICFQTGGLQTATNFRVDQEVPPTPSVSAPERLHRAGLVIAGLGGWVILQVTATAYARGVGADYPASRYMDTLAFGALVNAFALGWLLTTGHGRRAGQLARYALGLAWLVILASGLHKNITLAFRYELPDAKKYYIKAEGHMRRYLATNDPRELEYPDIPYPSASDLVDRLAHPSLRNLMPLPIRPPLAMPPGTPAVDRVSFEKNHAINSDWQAPPRTGLSPLTAPLDYTLTWGSFDAPGSTRSDAMRTWRSAPLTATLGGWLKFETAGDLRANSSDVRLELHDAGTGEVLAEVAPSRRPGDGWRSAYVRAPRVPFVIEATDGSASEWFAFSPPVEMGRFSYWAWQATKHARLLLYGASMAIAAIGVLMWWSGPTCSVRRSQGVRRS